MAKILLGILIAFVIISSLVIAEEYGYANPSLYGLDDEPISPLSGGSCFICNTSFSNNSNYSNFANVSYYLGQYNASDLVPYSGATRSINLNAKNISGIDSLNVSSGLTINSPVFKTALTFVTSDGSEGLGFGDIWWINKSGWATGFIDAVYSDRNDQGLSIGAYLSLNLQTYMEGGSQEAGDSISLSTGSGTGPVLQLVSGNFTSNGTITLGDQGSGVRSFIRSTLLNSSISEGSPWGFNMQPVPNVAFSFNGSGNFTRNVTALFFKGNGSLLTQVCLSNGTNCPASSGGNASFNQTYTDGRYINRLGDTVTNGTSGSRFINFLGGTGGNVSLDLNPGYYPLLEFHPGGLVFNGALSFFRATSDARVNWGNADDFTAYYDSGTDSMNFVYQPNGGASVNWNNGGFPFYYLSGSYIVDSASSSFYQPSLSVNNASNGGMQSCTLTAGACMMNNTRITDDTVVICSRQNEAGTIGAQEPHVKGRIASIYFNVTTNGVLETSKVGCVLVEPNQY